VEYKIAAGYTVEADDEVHKILEEEIVMDASFAAPAASGPITMAGSSAIRRADAESAVILPSI
jgi:hypothetical protein